jgi:hypothetical protein
MPENMKKRIDELREIIDHIVVESTKLFGSKPCLDLNIGKCTDGDEVYVLVAYSAEKEVKVKDLGRGMVLTNIIREQTEPLIVEDEDALLICIILAQYEQPDKDFEPDFRDFMWEMTDEELEECGLCVVPEPGKIPDCGRDLEKSM